MSTKKKGQFSDQGIGENMTLLNNILRRNANWVGHFMRRNYLIYATIEGLMMGVKGIGRRRRTQLLND